MALESNAARYERVKIDPLISVEDMEDVFQYWFSLHGRDLQPMLDAIAPLTWDNVAKAFPHTTHHTTPHHTSL